MNSHTDFILKPITCILEEAVTASAGIGRGIETYPLCDYVMQSVFLKMTGFQEQKMKCITWELATNDYEYRRTLLANEDRLGECSTYKDKSNIYKRLVEQLLKFDSEFKVKNIEKKKIRKGTTLIINNLFLNTNLLIWGQDSYNEFIEIWKTIESKHFVNDNQSLFTEVSNGISLKDIYENHLYKHRNRVAHNTQSYQQNLPTLKSLQSDAYIYENYFLWFAVLILIDSIFIELYKEYQKTLEPI